MIALKTRLRSLIVSVLKFLVTKICKGFHLAKNPVHTRPRRKKEVEESQGIL